MILQEQDLSPAHTSEVIDKNTVSRFLRIGEGDEGQRWIVLKDVNTLEILIDA